MTKVGKQAVDEVLSTVIAEAEELAELLKAPIAGYSPGDQFRPHTIVDREMLRRVRFSLATSAHILRGFQKSIALTTEELEKLTAAAKLNDAMERLKKSAISKEAECEETTLS